jgi:hypothetical protein
MNASTSPKIRWCWRKDLAEFRGLTDKERAGFLVLLEWFENFRLRHEMKAGREAANVFWSRKGLRPTRLLKSFAHAIFNARRSVDWIASKDTSCFLQAHPESG